MSLMMVSLDLERIQKDGYVMPNCFLRICNVEASTPIEALCEFRKKSGFALDDKYVKITKV